MDFLTSSYLFFFYDLEKFASALWIKSALIDVENIDAQYSQESGQYSSFKKQDTTIGVLKEVKEDTSAITADISGLRKAASESLYEKYGLLCKEIAEGRKTLAFRQEALARLNNPSAKVLQQAIEVAKKKPRIGVYSPVVSAAAEYLRESIPKYSASDEARKILEDI